MGDFCWTNSIRSCAVWWRLVVDESRNMMPMLHSVKGGMSGWWFQILFMFTVHPHFGKISNLTHIFQMGWNHKLVLFFFGTRWWCWWCWWFKILVLDFFRFFVYKKHHLRFAWKYMLRCFVWCLVSMLIMLVQKLEAWTIMIGSYRMGKPRVRD